MLLIRIYFVNNQLIRGGVKGDKGDQEWPTKNH